MANHGYLDRIRRFHWIIRVSSPHMLATESVGQ